MSEPIQAAGGVLVEDGRVAVVHRPRYDDWSLPKGKLDPGETSEEAALREVREETGYEATLGRDLGSTSYTDAHGRPKEARYWQMDVAGGAFEPNDEVDEVRWVTPDEARELLTYERDRALIDRLEDA